jgi:hypothetical protein
MTAYRDAEHLAQIRPEELAEVEPPVSSWWWSISDEERDQWCGLSVLAASRFEDPQRLYRHWGDAATTDEDRRYIDYRIARVQRLLAEHGPARVTRRCV